MKLKYIKSKNFENTYFYECLNCGLDIKPIYAENCCSYNCKCGIKFTKSDVLKAKDNFLMASKIN